MNIAVVGGGVFGSTAALYAARAGHTVTLYERLDDLLKAASAINQYRLHRGYHYPRSVDTARAAFEAGVSFFNEYKEALLLGGKHYYAIAREGSLVSADEFLAFCDAVALPYKKVHTPFLNEGAVALTIEAEEHWFDHHILRRLIVEKLREAQVTVRLNHEPTVSELEEFDKVILATYANLNATIPYLSPQEYQYELCEKPVVELTPEFSGVGIVVMDGPFMCVDPLGTGGTFVLGNVVHAIHAHNTGFTPRIPDEFVSLLNQGIITNPPQTHIKKFLEHGAAYIPALRDARHVGSMFTIRTVLPRQEKTDARPTLVSALDDRYIRIFSGKIGNCVLAAEKVVKLLA